MYPQRSVVQLNLYKRLVSHMRDMLAAPLQKAYFMYLGSKDTYCIFKTCREIRILFPTKCRAFHNFIFFWFM